MAELNLIVELGSHRCLVEFQGSTHEELLTAVLEEMGEYLAAGQEVSHLQLWNDKVKEFIDLKPNKMGSVKDGSKLNVVLKSLVTQQVSENPPSTIAGATSTPTTNPGVGEEQVSEHPPSTIAGATSSPTTNPGVGEELEEVPVCGIPPPVVLKGSAHSGPADKAAAVVSTDKLWKGREILRVYFLNPDFLKGWRSRGNVMTPNIIIAWAKYWCPGNFPEIPLFEMTEKKGKADIRVEFSDKSGCWSMVGTDAETVTDKSKPTMMLSLGCLSHFLQESLVVHEFGHALGLEHEHQRSDFWDILGQHIDEQEMQADPRVSGNTGQTGAASFGANWYKRSSDGECAEYDPRSIMHYQFKVEWLKDPELREEANVDKSTTLTPQAKKYLKGIHSRQKTNDQLPRRPSPGDYKTLVEAYGGQYSNSKVPEEPPSKQIVKGKILRVNDHLRHLNRVLWDARASWRRIGGQLNGITEGDLDAYECDNNSDLRLNRVLKHWICGNKATTAELLEVLEGPVVGRSDLAQKIRAGDKAKYGLD